MPIAGGQVPTQMEAPASAKALAMANPKPPSSATPAMKARFPRRSIGSKRNSGRRTGGKIMGEGPGRAGGMGGKVEGGGGGPVRTQNAFQRDLLSRGPATVL